MAAAIAALTLLLLVALATFGSHPARAADARCSGIAPAQRVTCAWLTRVSTRRCHALPRAVQSRCYTRRGIARYHLAKLLRSRHLSTRTGANPAAPTAPVPARSPGDVAADIALGLRGTPYVYGGSHPGGFDCSGLVQYAFSRAGRTLPRTTFEQFTVGHRVQHAQRGDLVFAYGRGHVGIALGDGTYVNAPKAGTVVRIQPMPGGIDGIVRID